MNTHVHISFQDYYDDRHDILRATCNALPDSFVDTLMAQGMSSYMYGDLLRRFPSASTVICPGRLMVGVLSEFLLPQQNRPVPLPNLEVLVIQGADIFDHVPDTKLYKMLKSRQKRGRPLKWLRLDSACRAKKPWLDSLLGVVHRVDMFGDTVE
ncbi:hypothetical protein BC834DRAFT_373900 [Gloeopeniophorella convolvens]|nr:hypothetical protein BC834DRAFT_373900 [Gloeopeniophorella convolvens]